MHSARTKMMKRGTIPMRKMMKWGTIPNGITHANNEMGHHTHEHNPEEPLDEMGNRTHAHETIVDKTEPGKEAILGNLAHKDPEDDKKVEPLDKGGDGRGGRPCPEKCSSCRKG